MDVALASEHECATAGPFPPEDPGQQFLGIVSAGQPGWIGVVVVDADDVRRHALPPIIADHRPCGVERLGQMIEASDVVALGLTVRQVGYAPRFVEGHPGDDARMALITLDHVHPFTSRASD